MAWSAVCVMAFALAAIAIPSASFAVSRDGGEVDYDIAEPDAEIFMTVTASPASVAAVRQRLAASKAVERFNYIDKQEAYAIFKQIFHDDPDLVNHATADALPESFRFDVHDRGDTGRLAKAFEAMPGVSEVMTERDRRVARIERRERAERRTRCGDTSDAEVFMAVAATPSQEDAVQVALVAMSGVTSVQKITRPQALKVFGCLFADDPKLVKSVTADELPVSFRLELAPGTSHSALKRSADALPGVDSTEFPG